MYGRYHGLGGPCQIGILLYSIYVFLCECILFMLGMNFVGSCVDTLAIEVVPLKFVH